MKTILSEEMEKAAASLAKTRIKCMDFPEEGDMAEVRLTFLHQSSISSKFYKIVQIDPISATLAAVRPGCINDGIVDFTRFDFSERKK